MTSSTNPDAVSLRLWIEELLGKPHPGPFDDPNRVRDPLGAIPDHPRLRLLGRLLVDRLSALTPILRSRMFRTAPSETPYFDATSPYVRVGPRLA